MKILVADLDNRLEEKEAECDHIRKTASNTIRDIQGIKGSDNAAVAKAANFKSKRPMKSAGKATKIPLEVAKSAAKL